VDRALGTFAQFGNLLHRLFVFVSQREYFLLAAREFFHAFLERGFAGLVSRAIIGLRNCDIGDLVQDDFVEIQRCALVLSKHAKNFQPRNTASPFDEVLVS
jgi:hypothetical protein